MKRLTLVALAACASMLAACSSGRNYAPAQPMQAAPSAPQYMAPATPSTGMPMPAPQPAPQGGGGACGKGGKACG